LDRTDPRLARSLESFCAERESFNPPLRVVVEVGKELRQSSVADRLVKHRNQDDRDRMEATDSANRYHIEVINV